LDYILPKVANFTTPDLILSGPNFGLNLGPFLYTLSGTIGATYAAVERGIPAIAYSGGYAVQTPYFWLNSSTAAGLQDPATIYGRLAANLAQAFIDKANGSRILPLGYGINVNIPLITSFINNSCVNPPYIMTRFTGGAIVDKAVYNATTGLFTFGNLVTDGVNQCLNGDCSLPGETDVVGSGCKSSVTVFTVDYDAPYSSNCNSVNARSLLPSLVNNANASTLVGGLGANASVAGTPGGNSTTGGSNSTATGGSGSGSTSTTIPTTTGGAAQLGWSITAAALAVMAAALVL
jgi:5'-nucleotidase